MRSGISVEVTAADRDRLHAIVANRNSPQKHVWRAAIVLATADGLGTSAVMRRTGKSKTAVWRWQERFAAEGVDGLLRDKTRPSRIAPFGPEVGERIVPLTLTEPLGETTHWTGRAMAKAAGVSLSYVQRVWRSNGLQPHRIRTNRQHHRVSRGIDIEPNGVQALDRSCLRGQGPRHSCIALAAGTVFSTALRKRMNSW